MTESVTILDQSGKVVKTSKEIFSIFKDAKDIYKEHKQELRQNAQSKLLDGKPSPKLLKEAGDAASVASSSRSHRSNPSHASLSREKAARGRAPLTAEALGQIEEGVVSDAGSTSSRSRLSKEGSDPAKPRLSRRHTLLPQSGTSSPATDPDGRPSLSRRHTSRNAMDAGEPRPGLSRRHTGMQSPSEVHSVASSQRDPLERALTLTRPRISARVDSVLGSVFGGSQGASVLSRRHTDRSLVVGHGSNPHPPSSATGRPDRLNRSNSEPDIHGDDVDMNLAYGKMPGPSRFKHSPQELELRSKVSKIDNLLLEAQCLQGTATAIITKLQSNPETMAAVALTLAQVSSMLKNFSPVMAESLSLSSPATMALLSSPQFMIAGGVAAGITVVAFGGYKIIKKMAEQKQQLLQGGEVDQGPAEALNYDRTLSSIDTWRRGVSVNGSEIDLDDTSTILSVGTSVEGEIITPEANRRKDERRRDRSEGRSVASGKTRPTMPRHGTSQRSAGHSDRSISYRGESRGAGAGDSTVDRPRRGEDRLGNELIVRPRTERSSSNRSMTSVKSAQSEGPTQTEARDRSRREAEEESDEDDDRDDEVHGLIADKAHDHADGDQEPGEAALVKYKASSSSGGSSGRRRKADHEREKDSTISAAIKDPSLVVDIHDEDKPKRREDRHRRSKARESVEEVSGAKEKAAPGSDDGDEKNKKEHRHRRERKAHNDDDDDDVPERPAGPRKRDTLSKLVHTHSSTLGLGDKASSVLSGLTRSPSAADVGLGHGGDRLDEGPQRHSHHRHRRGRALAGQS